MSFASEERHRRVTDPRQLRSLAHPLRLELLDQLMSLGAQTAAQCAVAVGSTTSNCSYHLRALSRAGLVERTQSADGRERPWRAAVTGVSYGSTGPGESPAADEAALVLDELSLEHEEELTRRARRQRDRRTERWRAAETYHVYALRLTATELTELTERIDQLVRPYITLTRDSAPDDAEAARLRVLAFRDPRSG